MFTRNDGKVKAEVVFDNGETVCYHATWEDRKGNPCENRFTACSKARFDREFS